MMREAFTRGASLLLIAWATGCGDEGSRSTAPKDAGTLGVPGTGDAAVEYLGPTRGGQIAEGAELEPEVGDNGPFEISDACCEVNLAVAMEDGDVSARVVGDLPPLDGDGKNAELAAQTFSVDVWMPVSEAVRYRFEVEVSSDAGTSTAYRTDPAQPTVQDENGELWNISAFTACDAADGG